MTIAHRLTTVKDMDKIFVFNEGRLVEQGTHIELLYTPNSTYARMWAQQTTSDDSSADGENMYVPGYDGKDRTFLPTQHDWLW